MDEEDRNTLREDAAMISQADLRFLSLTARRFMKRSPAATDDIRCRRFVDNALDLLDRTVIALWLGHESVETTQVYMHADMRLKEKALARVASTNAWSARYRPDDALLSFLESL